MMLSWAPIPMPHSTIPATIAAGLPDRKISPEKSALRAVDRISAFRPTLSNSQPKNSAANASTAIAPAYRRLSDASGKTCIFAAWSVISVKSAKPNAKRQIAII